MKTTTASKTAMVIGATGATGQALMSLLLNSDKFNNVIVVHYRPTPWHNHPQVNEIVMDFDQLETMEAGTEVDTVFCCIGTTIKKAGSKSAFVKVDHDYVLALGRWAVKHGNIAFHLISAQGANKKSMAFYMKVKGDVEDSLKTLNLNSLCIYHPSLLHGKRDEFRLMESISFPILELLGKIPFSLFRMLRPTRIEALANLMYLRSLKEPSGTNYFFPDDIATCE
ncbi:hypothetical protein [uncultured Endozoicomonas sp.]|uniref:hypothetical protein n=1 Tax=uncultured Endozoicomonas sp. TaxID=432652 RepID=UPI00261C39E9|nr:hypothetical protein [uncultured Endozoicomonas sp.]